MIISLSSKSSLRLSSFEEMLFMDVVMDSLSICILVFVEDSRVFMFASIREQRIIAMIARITDHSFKSGMIGIFLLVSSTCWFFRKV